MRLRTRVGKTCVSYVSPLKYDLENGLFQELKDTAIADRAKGKEA